jgi:hypothetical protein
MSCAPQLRAQDVEINGFFIQGSNDGVHASYPTYLRMWWLDCNETANARQRSMSRGSSVLPVAGSVGVIQYFIYPSEILFRKCKMNIL